MLVRRYVVGIGCTAGAFPRNEGMLVGIYHRIKSRIDHVDNVIERQVFDNIISGLCDFYVITALNKSTFL